MWASSCAEQSGALLSQLRWMSDTAEIPRLAVHAHPRHMEVHNYSFYTLCDFFMYYWRFYTDKLYSQSKHRSKKNTPESQFTSTKACSAVTRLNSCSLDTLTSLIFLDEEELSYKPAQQQGLSGQLTLSAHRAERHFGNQTPGLVIPSGPDLLSAQHLPVPGRVRPPRIRPSHLIALVASGFADCVSFFSKFQF